MPICIPKELPAFQTLANENIFVMDNDRASHQDIRPLIESEILRRVKHPAEHRLAEYFREYLRALGLHSFSRAAREDNTCCFHRKTAPFYMIWNL